MKKEDPFMAKKYVYQFSEGNGSMRELLGGKGANLAEMTNLGMPVPQGLSLIHIYNGRKSKVSWGRFVRPR